jgi:superfamily II DNA or RNA helicase
MNKIKGDEYELFVLNHIRKTNNVWLWKDIPEEHLLKSGLIHSQNEYRLNRIKYLNSDDINNPYRDVGIDILALTKDNKYIFVQCKNGYKNGITIADLAGFSYLMFQHQSKEGHVYYTSKLSIHIRDNHINKQMQFIKLTQENDIVKIQQKRYELYDYQKDAINNLEKWFDEDRDDNIRGVLNLPCGTGKTLISSHIANKYRSVVIISPLKQFAEQNLNRFLEYFPKFKGLLIDSEGSRDIEEISNFICKNKDKKLLFSATYKSIDIVNQLTEYLMHDPLIIIDEYHNLSKNNMTNKDDEMNKLLVSCHKILFLSATPRIYELENTEYKNDDFSEIFGGIAHKLSFSDAIKNKYICDYKIFLPLVDEDYDSIYDYIQKEINIKKIDDKLKAKCIFLLKCMLYHGTKKCIVYLESIKEIELFKSALKELDKFYCTNLLIYTLSSNDFHSNDKNNFEYNSREWKLDKFQNVTRPTVILSVQILDECIDVPSCDSIYIAHTTTSKIRTVQRMCRCLRKDNNNPNKIGHVYLWCTKYDDILETISGIKEYDIDYISKIRFEKAGLISNDDKVDYDKEKNEEKLINRWFVGVKEFKISSWEETLQKVINYIDKYGKRPSNHSSDNDIRILGNWVCAQISIYKKNIGIMRNKKYKDIWNNFIQEYKQYFMSSEENWRDTLKKVLDYINKYNKRPSRSIYNDKNIIFLATWITVQNSYYKDKTNIMKNDIIKKEWENIINDIKYKKFFISSDILWINTLNSVINYIKKNNKRPTVRDKNKNIKILGCWINTQVVNYKRKIKIMKNKNICKLWEDFITKYNKYFMTDEEKWFNILKIIENYIIKNKKRPLCNNKNDKYNKLAIWLSIQKQKYIQDINLMKNIKIRTEWEKFIVIYKEYL